MQKNGRPMPIHEYQKPWYLALCNDTDEETGYPIINVRKEGKRLLLHKPVGIGASSWTAYLLIWLATKDDALKNEEIALITGPNWDLAQSLLEDKYRKPFLRHNIILPGSKSFTIIDGVLFKTYSTNLPALRGREPKFLIVDEFDWFPPDSKKQVRETIERYTGSKNDSFILAMSTPASNQTESLMYQLEKEEPSIYQKISIDYTAANGTGMYTDSELLTARLSAAWRREYLAKWGGHTGNIFSSQSIDSAIEKGREFDLSYVDSMPWVS